MTTKTGLTVPDHVEFTPEEEIPDLSFGQTTEDGRFMVLDVISHGETRSNNTIADIYHAVDLETNKDAALKVFKEPTETAQTFTDQEIGLHAQASGLANVLPFVAAGHVETKDGVQRYLAVDYADGGTLEDAINPTKPDVETAIKAGLDVAIALDGLHTVAKIAHRDVRAANIMKVGDTWELGDYGIARPVGVTGPVRASGERTREVQKSIDDEYFVPGFSDKPDEPTTNGALGHLAPEAHAKDIGSPAADMYSFGVTLNEALTGQKPYADTGDKEGMHQKISREPPENLHKLFNGSIPREVGELAVNLVRFKPEDRATAEESASILAAAA